MSQSGARHPSPVIRTLRRLWPLLVVAAGLALAYAAGLDRYLGFQALADNREALLAWKAAHEVRAVGAFILIYYLAVLFSLPGAVWITIAGGFLFGTLAATVYVVIGATLGAIGIFLAARHALRDFFAARAGPAMRRMEAGFRNNAFSYLLVLRLVPLFPFWLVNLVPALIGVPLRTYAFATFFGIIPGAVVYTSVGDGLGAVFEAGRAPDPGLIFEPRVLLPILGLALLALIPVIYRKTIAKRSRGLPTGEDP